MKGIELGKKGTLALAAFVMALCIAFCAWGVYLTVFSGETPAEESAGTGENGDEGESEDNPLVTDAGEGGVDEEDSEETPSSEETNGDVTEYVEKEAATMPKSSVLSGWGTVKEAMGDETDYWLSAAAAYLDSAGYDVETETLAVSDVTAGDDEITWMYMQTQTDGTWHYARYNGSSLKCGLLESEVVGVNVDDSAEADALAEMAAEEENNEF